MDHGSPAAASGAAQLRPQRRSTRGLHGNTPIERLVPTSPPERRRLRPRNPGGFHYEVWVVAVDGDVYAIVDSKDEAMGIVEAQVPPNAFVEMSRELLLDLPPVWAASRDAIVRRKVERSLRRAQRDAQGTARRGSGSGSLSGEDA